MKVKEGSREELSQRKWQWLLPWAWAASLCPEGHWWTDWPGGWWLWMKGCRSFCVMFVTLIQVWSCPKLESEERISTCDSSDVHTNSPILTCSLVTMTPCGQTCIEKWRIWRSKLLIVKTQQGLPCQMPPRELPVAVLSVKRSRCAHILTHNSAKVMAPSSYPSEKPKLTLTLTLCCKDKETPQRSNVTKEKK